MTTKHTPGPWRIGTPPPNGEQTIGDVKGLMVAVATTGPGVDTRANANLIASAPKLLTTLRGAQAALRKALPYLPADAEAVFVGEWLDEINEAIDQATGATK